MDRRRPPAAVRGIHLILHLIRDSLPPFGYQMLTWVAAQREAAV